MSYSWNYTLAQAVIKAVINSSASNNKTLNDVDDIDSRDKDINYPQTLEDTHKHTEYLSAYFRLVDFSAKSVKKD